MPDDVRETRTIKHALFTYAIAGGGEAIAFRGDTVELTKADIERGEKFDAFTDEVGDEPTPEGSSLPGYEMDGDEAVQDSWVKSGTVEEILKAVNTNPEIAGSVLEAELRRKDNARKSLIEALASFTANA